jgi:hypothetical protein
MCVHLVGIKRSSWLWGCAEWKASKCLLLCRDVHYSGSLYFSAAPQILIFMNVPLPVFELLPSERHCTISRHSFLKMFHSNEWTLCVFLHTIKTDPNSWTGPVCRMNACIVYRRMLVDKCMYMPGVATTQLVGVTGEAPPSFLSKAILENSHKQQSWTEISLIPQQAVFPYVVDRQYWLRSVRQLAVLLPYGWLDECRHSCFSLGAYWSVATAVCLAGKFWSVLWGLDLRRFLVCTQCKPSFLLQACLKNICHL